MTIVSVFSCWLLSFGGSVLSVDALVVVVRSSLRIDRRVRIVRFRRLFDLLEIQVGGHTHDRFAAAEHAVQHRLRFLLADTARHSGDTSSCDVESPASAIGFATAGEQVPFVIDNRDIFRAQSFNR